MTDNRNNPAAPAFTQPGVGHHSSFICGKCHKPRATFGRRMQSVLGLRTWVCAACKDAKAKTPQPKVTA